MSDKSFLEKKDQLTNKQLQDMRSAGKRLTRGAINQFKQQSRSDILKLEQKKCSQHKKNNKKQKQKQRSNLLQKYEKQDKPKHLNQYLKKYSLKSYIALEGSMIQKQQWMIENKKAFQNQAQIMNKNFFLLTKFHLPQVFKFFQFKNIFEVRTVDLLQKKKQKEYLIIESSGKLSATNIKDKLAFLIFGHDLVFTKIYSKEFKQKFQTQLQQLKIMQAHKQNLASKNLQMKELSEQNYSVSQKNYRRDFQQFGQPQKSSQILYKQEGEKDLKKQIQKIQEESQKQVLHGSIENIIQQQKQDQFQTKIFNSFCLPGFDYILWPCIVFEPMIERFQVLEIIRSNLYIFNSKQKSKLFQKALNFNFSSNLSQSLNSNSYDMGQQVSSHNMGEAQSLSLLNQSEQKQSCNMSNEQIFAKIYEKVDCLNLQSNMDTILYLAGTEKFMLRNDNLIHWNVLNNEQINRLISKTSFKSVSQQLFNVIQKLNAFHKMENAEPKDQDIKLILNRLSKYQEQKNSQVKLCIPVRCSETKKKSLTLKNSNSQSNMEIESQKKIPETIQQKKQPPQKVDQVISKLQVLVLEQFNGKLKITSKEVDFDKIRPNYNLPYLGHKQKFLLYLADFGLQFQDFFDLAYSTFYFKDFDFLKQFRTYCPQKNLRQNDIRNHQRCIQCVYMIYDMSFVKCFICSKYCHTQCSQKQISKSFKEVFQLQNDAIQEVWICNRCEPCIICFRSVGNKYLQCNKCKSFQHVSCSKTKSVDNSNLKQNFMCQNCIKCKICQKKLKNQEYDILNNDYQCKGCTFDIQQKNICPICNKNQAGKWAGCTNQFCQRWIHYHCDKYILAHPSIWQQADHPYYCPICRKLQRRKVIVKCIKVLQHFDEYQFFIDPDYENIAEYNYVISENMCLTKMRALCVEGRYDENAYQLLLQDFSLLIQNALKYNMPKEQPHYQAKILNVTGSLAFDYFKFVILCSDEEIVYQTVWTKLVQQKKALFKFIYDKYLELLLNYKAQHGLIQVRRPKQKHQKVNHAQEPFVFSSRYIINQIFKSSIVQFKLRKKPMKIQNLFQCPKLIQAFYLPINKNYCFYHPLNSNINFFCHQCLQYYCCLTQCFKHRVCSCGYKGCLCDSPKCGCLPLKDKQKKFYESKLPLNLYDKRQLTQNYKYCLKCAFQRLTTKVCYFCRQWESFYQFQTCKICSKIYHKMCQNNIGINDLHKFFNKTRKNQHLPSNTRLEDTCYLCSYDRLRLKKTEQKIKVETIQKLMKMNSITKNINIIFQILDDCGIKLAYSQVINLFFANYEQYLKLQKVFDQFKANHYKINRNVKIEKVLTQNAYNIVKNAVKSNPSSMQRIFQPNRLCIKQKSQQIQSYFFQQTKKRFEFYNCGVDAHVVTVKMFNYIQVNQRSSKVNLALNNGINYQNNYYSLTDNLLSINSTSFTNIQIQIFKSYETTYKYFPKYLPTNSQERVCLLTDAIFPKHQIQSNIQSSQMDQQFGGQQGIELEKLVQIMKQKNRKKKQRQDISLQKKILKIYEQSKDQNAFSLNRSIVLNKKLTTFVKQIFQNSKACLRKGNTCIIRNQIGNWRVLKRGLGNIKYDISLTYFKSKWIYSINQNSWVVQNLSQIIQKTQRLSKHIQNFRELSEFLGFNIKSSFIQNLNHFTNFLQNNPLDNQTKFSKRKKILQVYDLYTWKKNGSAIKKQPQKHKQQEYMPKTNKIFYLKKRNQKSQNILQKQRPAPPYISYEDLKRDLDDMALFPKPDNFIITQPKNQVFIAPSKIHKLGLFTRSFSPKNTILIEYIGEIIYEAVADDRQAKFQFGCYMFGLNRRNIDKKQIIDATYRGNMARYLNHSCDPNCKAKIQVVKDNPRIFIYSIRDIKQYQQLTYDYQFNVDANDKLVCTCGAKNCQGRLN